MAGTLVHSPADILSRVLIALGHGVDPPGDATNWPVFVSQEPSTPDNVITLYDTEVRDLGRHMADGYREIMHGVQVRVRSYTYALGWAKINALAIALDSSVYQELVTIGVNSYNVHAVTRLSGPLSLGKEPETARRLFTLNVLVTVHEPD